MLYTKCPNKCAATTKATRVGPTPSVATALSAHLQPPGENRCPFPSQSWSLVLNFIKLNIKVTGAGIEEHTAAWVQGRYVENSRTLGAIPGQRGNLEDTVSRRLRNLKLGLSPFIFFCFYCSKSSQGDDKHLYSGPRARFSPSQSSTNRAERRGSGYGWGQRAPTNARRGRPQLT